MVHARAGSEPSNNFTYNRPGEIFGDKPGADTKTKSVNKNLFDDAYGTGSTMIKSDLKEFLERRFDALDKDNDNTLSLDELPRPREYMSKKTQAMHGFARNNYSALRNLSRSENQYIWSHGISRDDIRVLGQSKIPEATTAEIFSGAGRIAAWHSTYAFNLAYWSARGLIGVHPVIAFGSGVIAGIGGAAIVGHHSYKTQRSRVEKLFDSANH